VLDVLFLRAEGFSCSLGVLYGGPGISKLQFLIKIIFDKIFRCKFFSILVIKTLDLDPQLEKMPDSHLINSDPNLYRKYLSSNGSRVGYADCFGATLNLLCESNNPDV
jgi:hypothetical protein